MERQERIIDNSKKLRTMATAGAWIAFATPIIAIALPIVSSGDLTYAIIGAVFLGVLSLMLFTVAEEEKEDPTGRVATVGQWMGRVALVAFSVSLGLLTLIGLSGISAIFVGNDPPIGYLPLFLLFLFISIVSPFFYFLIIHEIEKRISAPWASWLLYAACVVSIVASGYFYR
jgi:hypothetical protein